jgi:chitinase
VDRDAQAYSREGFSGLNGRTDTAEYFYQSDFQTVLSFAQSVGMSRYTFWSVNRDRECDPVDNNDVTASECSAVAQNSWGFTAYTIAFANSAPVTPASPTPSPTPTTAYVSGDVVSYDGDQWTADQWNDDEVPGGPSGAWNNDGAC